MDDILHDINRLDLINQTVIGQESFSPEIYFKDFTRYYFARFYNNLTHVFKQFSISEIERFNLRHKDKLAHITKFPLTIPEDLITPIPPGMINAYWITLAKLLDVAKVVRLETIEQDLLMIQHAIEKKQLDTISIDPCSRSDIGKAKDDIGLLYAKTGLTHTLAKYSLVSSNKINDVNQTLLTKTKHYYPTIFRLNVILKKIEDNFVKQQFDDNDKNKLVAVLLNMAYRLSIVAIIAEHLQSLEHGFVSSIDSLLKKI